MGAAMILSETVQRVLLFEATRMRELAADAADNVERLEKMLETARTDVARLTAQAEEIEQALAVSHV